MITLNQNYQKLQASYLFSDIATKVKKHKEQQPNTEIISLGIGDVTQPLPDACLKAFHQGVAELGDKNSFRGYGPEQGYAFLRSAIAKHDYQDRGVTNITEDDIFISDGSKCDTGNFQELFSLNISVGVTDPVYPVYVDTNVMAGRTGIFSNGRYEGLNYLDCKPENNFTPEIPATSLDLIYLCSPNNPTGTVLDRATLTKWVQYARDHNSLILFDAAYESYISDESLPRSIFEIPGATEVAVEFRSFSKTAGFTGTRCAFTVVPATCRVFNQNIEPCLLRPLWNRRQSTKFNGVSYPVQLAASAIYSTDGQNQIKQLVNYYMENAKLIRATLTEMGFRTYGGIHAPYVWVECQEDSWKFFDKLLTNCGIVCTPGVGFGLCGQGYVRFSAFNHHDKVLVALDRMKKNI
jgi:LL-diaminopimelate aminotransferase